MTSFYPGIGNRKRNSNDMEMTLSGSNANRLPSIFINKNIYMTGCQTFSRKVSNTPNCPEDFMDQFGYQKRLNSSPLIFRHNPYKTQRTMTLHVNLEI